MIRLRLHEWKDKPEYAGKMLFAKAWFPLFAVTMLLAAWATLVAPP